MSACQIYVPCFVRVDDMNGQEYKYAKSAWCGMAWNNIGTSGSGNSGATIDFDACTTNVRSLSDEIRSLSGALRLFRSKIFPMASQKRIGRINKRNLKKLNKT